MLSMDWEDKWNSFREGKVEEARYINKNKLELTPEEDRAVKESVPETLYHVTTGDLYQQAVSTGFLGFNYVSKKAMSARRGYQPKGMGIFLAGSPKACISYGGAGFRQNWKEKGIVVLSVSKEKLNLDKLTLDLDVMTDLLGLDNTSREEFDYFLSSLKDPYTDPKEFSYHYADKIPIVDMKVEKGDFVKMKQDYDSSWGWRF